MKTLIAFILITSFSFTQEFIPNRKHQSPHKTFIGLDDYRNPNVGHSDGDKFQIYVDLFEMSYQIVDEETIESVFNEAKRLIKLNSIPLNGYYYDWSTFDIDLNNPNFNDIHSKILSGEAVSFGWMAMISKTEGFGISLDIDNGEWRATLRLGTFDLNEK